MANEQKNDGKAAGPGSAGPYTPATSPVNTGNKSGGEWQFEHSSAKPQEKKK